MQIEKDVPMPMNGVGSPVKYPFKDMQVGDSVFAEGQDSVGYAASAARAWGRINGRKFSARTVDGGVRIWRIA